MTELQGPYLHRQTPIQGQKADSQWEQIDETERRIVDDSNKEVDRLQRVINLGQRLLTIKNAPGYQQFEQAIVDIRSHAQNEMVGCKADNDQLRILQGRCQAFSSILALMRRTEHNLESLAQQLEAAEIKVAATIRPDGKVAPVTVGG